jgi:hypothetical protein
LIWGTGGETRRGKEGDRERVGFDENCWQKLCRLSSLFDGSDVLGDLPASQYALIGA